MMLGCFISTPEVTGLVWPSERSTNRHISCISACISTEKHTELKSNIKNMSIKSVLTLLVLEALVKSSGALSAQLELKLRRLHAVILLMATGCRSTAVAPSCLWNIYLSLHYWGESVYICTFFLTTCIISSFSLLLSLHTYYTHIIGKSPFLHWMRKTE